MCQRGIFSDALESANPILTNIRELSNCQSGTIYIPWKHLLPCPSVFLNRKFVLFPSHCFNDVSSLWVIETAVVLYVLCLKGNSWEEHSLKCATFSWWVAYGSSYCSLEAIIPTNKTTINGLSSLICLKGLQLKRWTKLNFKRPWSLCDILFLFFYFVLIEHVTFLFPSGRILTDGWKQTRPSKKACGALWLELSVWVGREWVLSLHLKGGGFRERGQRWRWRGLGGASVGAGGIVQAKKSPVTRAGSFTLSAFPLWLSDGAICSAFSL